MSDCLCKEGKVKLMGEGVFSFVDKVLLSVQQKGHLY